MAHVTIRRHGDRWALHENENAPIAEYETRELAEVAARDRYGDFTVDESVDGPGLGRGSVGEDSGHVRGRDAGIDQRTGGAGSADETPREPQSGL